MIKVILLTLVLAGCSHVNTSSRETDVFRRLAWIEGNVQSDYAPDAKEVERQIDSWKGSPPEESDTEEYLRYLSVLSASSRQSEAGARIQAYLAKHPNEQRAVFLLAVHNLRLKKTETAKYLFGRLEKDSSFKWKSLLFNNLGMIALSEGNRDQAMGYFQKAVSEEPRVSAAFANLGAIHLEGRNFSEAAKMFREAVQLDENFEDAVLGLGAALEGLGQFAQSHEVYERFIDDHPQALSVLYNDSIILGNRLKRKQEAAQLMQRYIQGGGKESARAQKILQTWR